MLNSLSNLDISTQSPWIKCFVKKAGGMENNNEVKGVVESNFRFRSRENESPFSKSQITS